MKRILLGVTYYWPNISGVSVYAKILAEELVKKSNKVEVLCSRFRPELKYEEKQNGVVIKRIKGTSLGKGFLMWSYPIESFRAVKRNEIISCQLPSLESFWLALWGKILGKKVIITHHCEFAFNGSWSNKMIALLTFPSHFFTYLLADIVVAYTEDYAQSSMYLRIFRNKLRYILPPIKLEKGKRRFDFGKGKTVAYVGRIAWEKGLDILIKAMKGVEAKLILAGPYREVVGDKTYEKLKKIIKDKVEMIGPLEHQDLKAFYENIDCLVLPSTNNLETFGIVQAEAMKCGTPVVASDLPGVRVPVTITGMGAICRVNETKDLAKKIREVLDKGKKYYQKRARNLDHFDYQKTIKAYEKIFGIN